MKVYLATFPTDDCPSVQQCSTSLVDKCIAEKVIADHNGEQLIHQAQSAICRLVEEASVVPLDGEHFNARVPYHISEGTLKLEWAAIPICYAILAENKAAAGALLFETLFTEGLKEEA